MELASGFRALTGAIYLRLWLANRAAADRAACWIGQRITLDEAGEGVISAAIAVLIMAFLGVALWLAFSNLLTTTTTKVNNQVNQIGG